MKKIVHFIFVIVLGMLYGCNDSVEEHVTYKINEPVFMPTAELRNSVRVLEEPQEIAGQGKICFYDGYLYLSEPGKGIHIIDNRNPSSPQSIGFIELIGNADLAVRNDMLYADSYVDLVWFDIKNPAKPVLKDRLENVFQQSLPIPEAPQFGIDYNMCFSADGKSKGVVVGWKVTERKDRVKDYSGCWDNGYFASAESSTGPKGNGLMGSMSRFGLYQDYLYSVINNQMEIFHIADETPVKTTNSIYIGRDVETIFSYKENMFLGTPTGMLIYSVTDPLKPEFQSSISHVYGCDPVVVENDLAYVTIHSGDFCGQENNELFIIDVSNVKKPQQIVSYAMTHPKGLGIDNKTLFICDEGLKIYNAADPQKIMSNRLAHYSGMDGLDVIPFNNILMMIADDGIYQYDYSDLQNIRQLSKLPVKK